MTTANAGREMSNPNGTMTEIELLDAERAALLACVGRVPEELQTKKPAPDCWSVTEVLEHLARVERGVAKLLALRGQETPDAGADLAGAQLDAARVARLRNRVERIKAPERIQPQGALTAEEVLRALDESRSALRAALLAASPAALDGATHAHPLLGALTLRSWACFIAHHEARHAQQISEIGAALGA
jgi:hypothetical protein